MEKPPRHTCILPGDLSEWQKGKLIWLDEGGTVEYSGWYCVTESRLVPNHLNENPENPKAYVVLELVKKS